MSSNNATQANPKGHNHRVALAVGDDTSQNRLQNRKRKQATLEESNAVPDEITSRSAEDSTVEAPISTEDSTADPPAFSSDEDEVISIVTTRLTSDNAIDIGDAMVKLNTLVFSNHDNKKTAFRCGAHIIIVQAMRRYVSFQIQASGIALLSNICSCKIDNTSVAKDIIAVGGLTCSLLAMAKYNMSTQLSACGCSLIATMWIQPNLRKKVVDEGGLDAVKNAMEMHDQHAIVQRFGCNALAVLLHQEEYTWAKAAVDLGCLELVITAMNNHTDSAEVQEHGCTFLAALSKSHEDYRYMILEAKGLGPIGKALCVHKDNAPVMLAARNALTVISA